MDLKKILSVLFLFYAVVCNSFANVKPNERERLIHAIAKVESKLNEKAVSGDCVGYLQIRPILVKECNNILKERGIKTKFTLSDRLSKEKSIEMFKLFQEKHNPKFELEKAIWIWNAGSFAKVKPRNYIRKVMNEFKKS